jgi:hypothetical protein
MLLTIPNKILDSLLPTTEQHESTQVEVALDQKSAKYSIVVMSDEASVQSVVDVPTQARTGRHLWNSNKVYKTNDNVEERDEPLGRVVGRGRNMSPRQSRPSQQREGGSCRQAASCPPPISHRVSLPTAQRISKAAKAALKQRDVSCPPAFRGYIQSQAAGKSGNNTLERQLTTSYNMLSIGVQKSYKPNLVQKSLMSAIGARKKKIKRTGI